MCLVARKCAEPSLECPACHTSVNTRHGNLCTTAKSGGCCCMKCSGSLLIRVSCHACVHTLAKLVPAVPCSRAALADCASAMFASLQLHCYLCLTQPLSAGLASWQSGDGAHQAQLCLPVLRSMPAKLLCFPGLHVYNTLR